MKNICYFIIALMFMGCSNTEKSGSIEMITRASQQDSLFKTLATISQSKLPDSIRNDSLAFLILPVQASCPSCRKKTIDSILKHQNDLADNRIIIITGKGGRKTMNSYFLERDGELPDIQQLILDSTNQAHQYDLFRDNPAIYYAANNKVYKKVLAIPATVKQDLQEFFSGWRNDK